MSFRNYIHTMVFGDSPDTLLPRGLHITTLVVILAWVSFSCVLLIATQSVLIQKETLGHTYGALFAKKVTTSEHIYGSGDIEHSPELDVLAMNIVRNIPRIPETLSHTDSMKNTLYIVGSSLFISPHQFIQTSLRLPKVKEFVSYTPNAVGPLRVGVAHQQYRDTVWGIPRQGIVIALEKSIIPDGQPNVESSMVKRYDAERINTIDRIFLVLPGVLFWLMIITAGIGLLICIGAVLYGMHYKQWAYIFQALLVICLALCLALIVSRGMNPEIALIG